MGNGLGRVNTHISKKRSKKSRQIPDSKPVEETQDTLGDDEEEKGNEGKHLVENEEELERENDDGQKEEKEEDCNEQQPDDKEEAHQDQTQTGEGEEVEAEGGSGDNNPSQVISIVQPVPRSVEEFVGLNIGGVVYRTSRSTLVRYPDSLLGVIFTASIPTPLDDQGNYMIDGDGEMFRHILNYIRRGTLCLPKDFQEHRLLQQEAVFFQLSDLEQLISQHFLNTTQIVPKETSEQIPIRVETASEASKYVIEIYVSEEDDRPQSWRIYGSLSLLAKIPTLRDYLHNYRKGSQCLEFTTQHPMFPSNTFRRFPKTTLFYHIFELGFKLHTSDSLKIIDENNDKTPWLRYLFTSTTL